ncbi:unnamed protein product [Rangifer tarandus platyrhynchus]|uniref:Uncharacterized protein n=1 Tax=Rangifer tarandus platyrhynchus TaxID=3082113 RepID=A0AC60AAD1_RANTA
MPARAFSSRQSEPRLSSGIGAPPWLHGDPHQPFHAASQVQTTRRLCFSKRPPLKEAPSEEALASGRQRQKRGGSKRPPNEGKLRKRGAEPQTSPSAATSNPNALSPQPSAQRRAAGGP